MKKIGIFFGSSTGTTEGVAQSIASMLGVDDANVHNVDSADAAEVANYELLLLGSSTWGMGDLQDDWESFLPSLAEQDLNGKEVAFFGCGDSASYSDTFCSALATIKEELAGTGCTFIGQVPAEGYSYDETSCEEDGMLIGCLIDEDNESDQTEERLAAWIEKIK